MERLRAELESRLALLGGHRDFATLAALVHWADSRDAFADWALWGGICDFAEERFRTMGPCEPFATRYRQALDAGGEAALARLALDDMREGRVLAALALRRMRVSRELPLVAAAAFGRHAYAGLGDGFALVRLLAWSRFDLNATEDEGGMTALHLFACCRSAGGSNPRAVGRLVARGADARRENHRGDSPMTFLCASRPWSLAHTRSFAALLQGGADPFKPSRDGETPMSLLAARDIREPQSDRSALVAAMAEWHGVRDAVPPSHS